MCLSVTALKTSVFNIRGFNCDIDTRDTFVCFFLTKIIGNTKHPFLALCGIVWPMVLNFPVSFVPGSVRYSSALCLYPYFNLHVLYVSLNYDN